MVGVIRGFLSYIRRAEPERFAGLIDFSYQHYALGDVLTTEVNLACLALEAKCTSIDLYLMIDPTFPSAPAQGFVTPHNYTTHLDNLVPAFLCLPGLASLRIIRDPLTAGLTLCSLVASRAPMWPPLRQHLRRRMTYPLDHKIINRFFARERYLPHLTSPRGYAGWAREFLARHYPDRFVVCINPRQSRLTQMPATIYRDAPLEDWRDFIEKVGRTYPDTHFFMLGGYAEWEHTLVRYGNVSIPRAMGLTLAHELALLRSSHLFMGTSSGFATMATFTDVPYVITHLEHVFAGYAGIPVNAPRYPFAGEEQYLVWRQEDAQLLLDYFENIYGRARRETPA